MKILAQGSPGSTIAGFRLAAEAAGHQWIWWEEHHTSAFDVFDEVQPDMVMFMDMTRPLSKCIKEHQKPTIQGFREKPFTFEVNRVVMDCERLVDSYIFNKCEGPTSYDVPVFACTFGIVARPNPVGLHLCYREKGVKVMSDDPWPVHQYLGVPSLMDKRDLYRSATVVVIDNMIEAMRVIGCGSIPVSCNDSQELHELIPYMNANKISGFVKEMLVSPDYRRELLDELPSLLVNRTYETAFTTILESL